MRERVLIKEINENYDNIMATTGKVIGIVSNLVTVQTDGPVAENDLCFINLDVTVLLAEVF